MNKAEAEKRIETVHALREATEADRLRRLRALLTAAEDLWRPAPERPGVYHKETPEYLLGDAIDDALHYLDMVERGVLNAYVEQQRIADEANAYAEQVQREREEPPDPPAGLGLGVHGGAELLARADALLEKHGGGK